MRRYNYPGLRLAAELYAAGQLTDTEFTNRIDLYTTELPVRGPLWEKLLAIAFGVSLGFTLIAVFQAACR